jgi:hypothetical protein
MPGFLYCASLDGLRIFSLANPAAPALVATHGELGGVGLDLAGGLVYLTRAGDATSWLEIYELADPEQPVLLGGLARIAQFGDVDVLPDRGTAYVQLMWSGALLVDVSDPAYPQEVGTLVTRGLFNGLVEGADLHVYGALDYHGLMVGWIYDPLQPELVGSLPLDGAYDIDLVDGLLPAVVAGDRIAICRHDCWVPVGLQTPGDGPPSAGETTLQVSPNPFNPATVVTFDLGIAGEIELAVFDLTGRRIARLVDGYLPAGRQNVVWRGIDQAGRPVASGTYLLRLLTGQGAIERKVTVIK